jgi:ATP/maltotriose-dependent transcriptional regulator MalT/DNA-binding SARP family transcriptional activator
MARQGAIAKISRPRLFGVVARQRLFALLDENRGRPLLWVDGPPGGGKTTFVASYLEARRIPTLWYQVEPGDADPANLFHYLTLAAGAFPDTAPFVLPRLMPEHLGDLAAFARTFFRQLFMRLPAGVVLVLDNYQEAPTDGPLHDIVRAAVSDVPPGSSICCVSRTEAPPSFAQLAANGSSFALSWDMLRLTLDETRAISAGRGVRDDWLVRALHQQSEGWVAGITLMLERLGHVTADAGVLPKDTRESVFNYFASLLFDRAPETTRQTLLSIAFLPHVTADMAQSLSGREEAGELLEQLYRRHLFTDRRPAAEPVYQFHALFRDFLQTRVCESTDAGEVQRLKVRSASVLEAHGDVAAAIDLRIGASDWDEATRSILREAKGLLDSGRRQTLERWIEALPQRVKVTQPWLVYWLGVAHVQTAPARGIETLQEALRQFQTLGDRRGQVLCLTALLNAAFLGYLALDAMDAWLDELLANMERVEAFSSSDIELRVWGVLCWVLFWNRPWHPWTVSAAQRVEALIACSSDPNVALRAASSALAQTTMRGDFASAERIALATGHLAHRPGASPSDAAWWLVQVGYLRFFPARYEEALEFMRQACQLAEMNGMRATFATTILHRCMVEFRAYGWDIADATLAEVEAMRPLKYPMPQAQFWVYQARRAHSCGRLDEAADWAELTHSAILTTRSQYQEMLYGLCDSEILLAAGRIEKARSIIARTREIIERAPVFDCWRAALVFDEAWLAEVEGKRAVALARLRESLLLAKERNRKYYLRYLESAMPPLFTLALEGTIEVEFVQQIIRMFRLKPPVGAPDLWPWSIRIRTLGRFEVLVNDEPLEFSRKVPKKTLALLKVLVAYGGEEVSEQSLCDALWGDEEADAARQALGITVVRLRKLLGVSDAVLQQGGKISLDRTQCWVDAWRFEQRTTQLKEPGAVSRGLVLYGGKFLPEDEGEPWSVPARERLRGKFIHLLATHGHSLETAGETDGAIALYLRGIDADPIVEAFHQGLMRCYRQLDRHTEAISVYRRLRQTLSVVLGVAPSLESQDLYRTIIGACAERPEATESQSVIPLAVRSQTRRNRSKPARSAG